MHRRATALLIALLSPAALAAQRDTAGQQNGPRRAGDSTIVAATYAATRIIYDSSSGRVYSFTRTNALDVPGATATELQGSFLKGAVSRIVAASWGSIGKYAIEFYFHNDSLIFSFETFEYISDNAPPGQWRNFKGLPAWERRIFWKGKDAAFVETRGLETDITPRERERVRQRANRLREMVRARASEVPATR